MSVLVRLDFNLDRNLVLVLVLVLDLDLDLVLVYLAARTIVSQMSPLNAGQLHNLDYYLNTNFINPIFSFELQNMKCISTIVYYSDQKNLLLLI